MSQTQQLPCGCPKNDEYSICVNQAHLAQPIETKWEEREEFRLALAEHSSSDDEDLLIAFIRNLLAEERHKTIEAVKDLFDEYNNMDDNAIQFELRIGPPKLHEFIRKINELKEKP